jgi:hypothetical protein
MSKTILNKLKKSFTELNKIILNEYLIDITKNNIKYQITITKKIIDINMNDDEIIAFFFKYICVFKSSIEYNGIKSFTSIDEFIYMISNSEHIIKNTLNNNIEIFYKELDKFITNKLKLYKTPEKKVMDIDPPNAPKKIEKKLFKYEIEPKNIFPVQNEEIKKKDLSTYNTFYKEQSIILKDKPEIKNKMEYIAKLWQEAKKTHEPMEIVENVIPTPIATKKKIKNTIEPIEKMEIVEDIEKKQYKKQNISSTVKRLVWNTTFGEEIGKSKCVCCKSTYITQLSFHCGHVISESKGGETIVSNLRPICQNCNSSMGNKNMDEFMKSLK